VTTVRELVESTAAVLGDHVQAQWLVEVAVSADHLDEVLDEDVTERMVAHLDSMVGRLRTGEPLQYVLGRWAFRHLDLFIDQRVLIPRPETEEVAGVAIEFAKLVKSDRTVIDLGTGSGRVDDRCFCRCLRCCSCQPGWHWAASPKCDHDRKQLVRCGACGASS